MVNTCGAELPARPARHPDATGRFVRLEARLVQSHLSSTEGFLHTGAKYLLCVPQPGIRPKLETTAPRRSA
jgi:hypothetical protein